MDIREKNIILTQAEIILDHSKSLQNKAYIEYKNQGLIGYFLIIRQINSLITKYNKLVPRINSLLIEESIKEELNEINKVEEDSKQIREKKIFSDTETPIVNLIFGCSTIKTYLSVTSSISEESIDKLTSITKELNSIKKEIQINIYQNLMEAKTEFERGCFLGSALICGKVIRTCIDQISGKDINEKIETLRKYGLIMDKDGGDKIMKANHYGRNLLSHDLSIFPTSSESVTYLGESIKIATIFSRYNKLKDNKDNSE